MPDVSHDRTIYVDRVDDFIGNESSEKFLVSAISTGAPNVVLDGAGGLDTLDARNVFVGYSTMSFRDTEVDGANGFSFGDFDAVNFEQIFGNSTHGNRFLVQYLEHEVVLHGGEGDDWFAASFGPRETPTSDTFHGYGGDDYFSVRPLDQAFGGDGDDIFSLYATSGDLTGSFVDGGNGRDTLKLSFGWTVDLSKFYADSPFSGSSDRYVFENIENVEVYAWRGYHSHVIGDSGANILSVNVDRDDGSVGVHFDGLAGHDTLTGSKGSDTLNGGQGNDFLFGDLDGDFLVGGRGGDTLSGGDGSDRLYDGAGSDAVYGGANDDYVRVGGGADYFYGGSGKDYISYYDSTDGVNINLETNEVSGSWASNDTISGFESASGSRTGNDVVHGTSGSNTIKTYGGDDKVYAGFGTDKVELGDGNDYVRVGGGQESFDGGAGTDYISYYDSSNGIFIDLEADTVSGSWAVNDTIKNFESASGSCTGDDVILGTSTSNTLGGFGGDDKLYGREGDDKLFGGSGEDRFDGGAGTDLLYGGADADVFHFDRGEDHDIIKDFENNIDEIQLDNFNFAAGQDAFDFAYQVGADVVFIFGGGDILTVEGVSIGLLYNDLTMV
ncbi:calcium-binding protein [Yoonia sp. 208BN28-4]|uniref:calcium-binding protein n=1 Tax=Yoonia sp. 208BN28-4 TaxID=3126505 RepID=UPI0030B25D6A